MYRDLRTTGHLPCIADEAAIGIGRRQRELPARHAEPLCEQAGARGSVRGGQIIINGHVSGPVHSTELLELQPKAVIIGDVRYEVLEMHQGATIDGELKPLKVDERPALKLAASKAG